MNDGWMWRNLIPLKDKQDVIPMAYCDKCGGEIYPDDVEYRIMDGELVCGRCLEDYDMEEDW